MPATCSDSLRVRPMRRQGSRCRTRHRARGHEPLGARTPQRDRRAAATTARETARRRPRRSRGTLKRRCRSSRRPSPQPSPRRRGEGVGSCNGGQFGDVRDNRSEREAIPEAGVANGSYLRRWVRPRISRTRYSGRHFSDNSRFPPERLSGSGRRRGADLHQSEQCLDRDRGAAFGARHCRQLLPRSRERMRGHDDRRGPDAQRDDPSADGAGRRQDGGGHRQRQIAQAARAQSRRHLLFVRMRRRRRRSARRARQT